MRRSPTDADGFSLLYVDAAVSMHASGIIFASCILEMSSDCLIAENPPPLSRCNGPVYYLEIFDFICSLLLLNT